MELFLLHVTEPREVAAADSLDSGVGEDHVVGGMANRYL